MSEQVVAGKEGPQLVGAVLPLGGWAVATALLSVVGIESAVGALPGAVASHARATAYLSVSATAGVTLGLGVLFAFATGAMLWWVEKPVNPATLVTSVAKAYWVLAGYCVVVAVLMLVYPMPQPTLAEILDTPDLAALLFRPVSRLTSAPSLRIVVLGLACMVVWWQVAKVTGRSMALLGVAAGASVVAFVLSLLSRLAGMSPL